MTTLYAMDLQPYHAEHWRDLLPDLPDARRRRVLACRFELDRARVAGTGWLLQYALKEAGIDPKKAIFTENEHGKPLLANTPDVHFSLSHGGNWAVCALSDTPLGVDVELPRCTMKIARRYFQEEELEYLSHLSELQQRDALNRLWTGKEAFIKALGVGLSQSLDSFQILLTRREAILKQELSPLPYVLHEYQPDICRICLCAVGEKPILQIVSPKG